MCVCSVFCYPIVNNTHSHNMKCKHIKCPYQLCTMLHQCLLQAPHSVPLVRALTTMATQNQPEVFFTFAGTPGAVSSPPPPLSSIPSHLLQAITLPPISKWPSEFSIQLWLRLEKPYDCQRDYYKPVVYWFRTSRPEYGYSSHFIGNKLIIETFGRGQKRPQTHALDMTFAPYRWYMLSVVYVYHRVKSSSLTVFVDGAQILATDVTLPNTSAVSSAVLERVCVYTGNVFVWENGVYRECVCIRVCVYRECVCIRVCVCTGNVFVLECVCTGNVFVLECVCVQGMCLYLC